LKRLPRELPAEFDILIDDVDLHACSPGELQINMQELDAVAQYLCSIGYESWKWHDQLTLRTYFRFRRQNNAVRVGGTPYPPRAGSTLDSGR
jgi:hypothetical protein